MKRLSPKLLPVKTLLYGLILGGLNFSFTDSVVAIPYFPSPSVSNAQETISTQDGTVCTQSVGGRTSLNMGIYGSKQSSNRNFSYSRDKDNDFGGFVMLNVPLRSSPRLNCAKLLEIEVERARIRLEMEKFEMLSPTDESTNNPMYAE